MDPEIERIRACARHSVGRGFLFALLAIVTTVAGMIGWPVSAMRMGALLCMLTTAVLALRARHAPFRPYKRTETWVLLDRRHGLPEPRAQAAISGILAETYWRFAEMSAALALALWIAVFVFALLRLQQG
jgi:hypothetical protein